MKTIDSIPTSKIQRASKLVSTGAKVGVNYLKYYGNKLINSEESAKEIRLELDQLNEIQKEGKINNVKNKYPLKSRMK